jgi:hypothetical protein
MAPWSYMAGRVVLSQGSVGGLRNQTEPRCHGRHQARIVAPRLHSGITPEVGAGRVSSLKTLPEESVRMCRFLSLSLTLIILAISLPSVAQQAPWTAPPAEKDKKNPLPADAKTVAKARRWRRRIASPAMASRARATGRPRLPSIPSPPTGHRRKSRASPTARSSGRSTRAVERCLLATPARERSVGLGPLHTLSRGQVAPRPM